MLKDFSWQQVHDVPNLSCGLLLSATDSSFIVKDMQDNTILQILPDHDFISEYCKYPCEIFELIKSKLSCSFEGGTIFYDSFTSEKISQLCESNRLLF